MKIKLSGMIIATILTLSSCDSSAGRTTPRQDTVITVEARQTLAMRIDAGKYDYINASILSNFTSESVLATYNARLVVVSFNHHTSSEYVIAAMKARGLRPANTNECLASGVSFNKAPAKFELLVPGRWAVCLGGSSVVNGERKVLALNGTFGIWGLNLLKRSSIWPSDGRFLAIRH